MVALLLVLYLTLHGLWRLFGRPSPWPPRFLGRLAHAAGIDVACRGTPLRRHVLYVANHLTWFDITILAGATGTRFISKDDVARWPLIGFLAGLNRTIFIARAERGQVARQAEAVRIALAEGTPVTLFPEGGTGDGVALKPFRASLFAAALGCDRVMIQPVAIDYGAERRLVAWTDHRGGFGAELFRLLGLAGRRQVTLHFLDPIDPAQTGDRKRVAACAQARIAAALGETGVEPV
ncbi:lysophospholipid acyltransferase family protein [Sphingomonas morindae]|uniref:1-acyl-sn-glycerol-3-phosphate acyltransferase n=1 Tax=Sphingomonas morindae TaxID=1541170 RepID=A0ABY4X6Q5_9SPHN|nr:lysophospholipid acyltransferase family protein [Sphingomonas morindae]USI72608.1 1-acyl-sn-glycerol-3-phosphate acyltransferase [Sphingomonas morindae]